jgi:hypothetical protein
MQGLTICYYLLSDILTLRWCFGFAIESFSAAPKMQLTWKCHFHVSCIQKWLKNDLNPTLVPEVYCVTNIVHLHNKYKLGNDRSILFFL